MGLSYLVGLTELEREALTERFLPKHSPERAGIEKLLEQALEQYSRLGYVTAYGTWHSYIKAVGVPYRPRDGSPPLSFTCGGIAEIISDKSVMETIGPGLIRLRSRVEGLLSGEDNALPTSLARSANVGGE